MRMVDNTLEEVGEAVAEPLGEEAMMVVEGMKFPVVVAAEVGRNTADDEEVAEGHQMTMMMTHNQYAGNSYWDGASDCNFGDM